MQDNEEIIIRLEKPEDYRNVEELNREAFWNHFVPGGDEHYLVHTMRSHPDFVPELAFVAEKNGEIIGNIMYSRSVLRADTGREIPVLIIGPVAVTPRLQRMGLGKKLILHSLQAAREMGFAAVFLYGDPAYYSRHGFECTVKYKIRNADGVYPVAMQVLALQDHALDGMQGVLIESPVFLIDAEKAELFDANFPPKEKKTGGYMQERFAALLGATVNPEDTNI